MVGPMSKIISLYAFFLIKLHNFNKLSMQMNSTSIYMKKIFQIDIIILFKIAAIKLNFEKFYGNFHKYISTWLYLFMSLKYDKSNIEEYNIYLIS